MFQDRRQSPRQPALIRTICTVGRERVEVVCTSTSPTGAFFTTRNPPPLGAEVVIELRAGGVDSPIVDFHAIVVRAVQPGTPNPAGFAVLWRMARCEVGPEPLFRVLQAVLRLPNVGETNLAPGRTAEYAFRLQENTQPVDPGSVGPNTAPSSPATRPSSVHQALGVWSPPMHRVAPSAPRETTNPGTLPRPPQHALELEPPARVTAPRPGTASQLPPALATAGLRSGASSLQTGASGLHRGGYSQSTGPFDPGQLARRQNAAESANDRSQIFDALREPPSMAVGRMMEHSSQAGDAGSQSWPVYALAPGERRAVTDQKEVAAQAEPNRPVLAPTARHTSGANLASEWAAEVIGHKARPASGLVSSRPIVVPKSNPLGQPSSEPFGKSLEPTQTDVAHSSPLTPPRRKAEAARMLVATDVPVTFLHRNHFVPARLIGIAEQLAAVLTQQQAPDLDELLVIHLPVRANNVWRTVNLSGKLLQVAADTPDGKRFVMHIERLEEGRHKGVFREFLLSLSAP